MNIEQAKLDSVETKLDMQNALRSGLGAAIFSIPILIIWYFSYQYNPNFGSVMLLVSGLITGAVIRFSGNGFTVLFSVLAFISHALIVTAAFLLQIVIAGTISTIIIFGFYISGAIAAIYIARKDVPFEEHRAFHYLTSVQPSKHLNSIRNKWYLAVPLLFALGGGLSYISVIGLAIYDENQAIANSIEESERKRIAFENKNIDITPNNLARFSAKQALLYSYAYYNGMLFNSKGNYSEPFPLSEYKAKKILEYLVDHKNNTRAKFILGFLSASTQGMTLIEEAEQEGDKFAQLYSAINYGCISNSDLAKNLLLGLYKLAPNEAVKLEAESAMYRGFPNVCEDLEKPRFLKHYIFDD